MSQGTRHLTASPSGALIAPASMGSSPADKRACKRRASAKRAKRQRDEVTSASGGERVTMKTKNTQNMKKTISSSLILGAVLGVLLALNAPAQDTKPTAEKPLSAERTILVTVTAKVEAIDQAKRQVTLKGPLGNVVTFVADERIK